MVTGKPEALAKARRLVLHQLQTQVMSFDWGCSLALLYLRFVFLLFLFSLLPCFPFFHSSMHPSSLPPPPLPPPSPPLPLPLLLPLPLPLPLCPPFLPSSLSLFHYFLKESTDFTFTKVNTLTISQCFYLNENFTY